MSNVRIALALVTPVALLAPQTAAAAVVINEIAWMGSAGNANAEWIELYNDGSDPVALSGWTLTSAGAAPNIALSGTITGNGFYLLERTSDASVAGVTADQIYTGALSNSGDTLTLKDSGGAVVDQVAGGDGWSAIGGDNATKQTPQRSGSSWVTAASTPRAANAAAPASGSATTTTPTPTETATTTPDTTIGGSVPARSQPVASPVRTLYLDAGPDRIVLAGVRSPYRAAAYSKNGSSKDARVTWSFGDGGREMGEAVWHTYRKPGEYMVTARAEDNGAEALVALRVLVEEPMLSIQAAEDGIYLTNTGQRVADLSGWRIMVGDEEFTIPDDTGVWAGATIFFAREDTGLPAGELASLLYPSGAVAGSSFVEVPHEDAQPLVRETGIERIEAPPLPAPVTESAPDETVIDAPTAPPLSAAVGAAVPSLPSSWLMCLFGGLLACGATLVVR